MFDSATGRRRVVHALIFTAVYLAAHVRVVDVLARRWRRSIAGCEAAWRFFGGVFKVLVPDNMSTIVAQADSVNPRFTVGWLEYAQARGFATDPARVAHPRTNLGLHIAPHRVDARGVSCSDWPVRFGGLPILGGCIGFSGSGGW